MANFKMRANTCTYFKNGDPLVSSTQNIDILSGSNRSAFRRSIVRTVYRNITIHVQFIILGVLFIVIDVVFIVLDKMYFNIISWCINWVSTPLIAKIHLSQY